MNMLSRKRTGNNTKHRVRIVTRVNMDKSCVFLILALMVMMQLPNLAKALTVVKAEAFDTVDSPSFCDSRRFEVIEGTSGVIYSHRPYFPSSIYRPGRDCFLTLKVPVGYRVELVAMQFQVGQRYAPSSRRCAGDSLHIFDQDKPDTTPKKARSHPGQYQDENSLSAILTGNSSVASPIKANLCGRLKNNTVIARSTMNIITLWWHTDNDPTGNIHPGAADQLGFTNSVPKRGFKLQWTAFRDRPESGCDQADEFSCTDQNICIPLELACDNVAHCGDKSDMVADRQRAAGCRNIESDIVSSRFTIGSLVGICLGSVLLLVLAFILISVCRKRQRLSRRHHKYNQAPSAHIGNCFAGDRPGTGTVATSSTNKSSNSSNSDTSRADYPCNDLVKHPDHHTAMQHDLPVGFMASHLPQQHQAYPNAMGLVMANGNTYQRYQQRMPYHTHHHHAPPPMAPPPSMVGDQAGIMYEGSRPYPHKKATTQPLIQSQQQHTVA